MIFYLESEPALVAGGRRPAVTIKTAAQQEHPALTPRWRSTDGPVAALGRRPQRRERQPIYTLRR
ncbi:hypothetical protein KCP69_12205 [Salmonella enterica subsp. enterica]|nr:hypothetical protein KCP69_12205 [Salmonella enterica subsp. enterica]